MEKITQGMILEQLKHINGHFPNKRLGLDTNYGYRVIEYLETNGEGTPFGNVLLTKKEMFYMLYGMKQLLEWQKMG